jgi:hypothetical protein
MGVRTPRYRNHILTAIEAAKMSIEMFNRVNCSHKVQAALIFNTQAWELFAKGLCIRKHNDIYNKDGSTITAEQAVNRLQHQLRVINKEEDSTIQQVISLRHEAMHGILPVIDEEILTHLMYYSLKTFHRLLKENFRTYFTDFDKNYLSVAFKEYTFYSNKVSRLFRSTRRYGQEKNKILYLLDRACNFAEDGSNKKMLNYKKWQDEIKKLPRKSRISRHLNIYNYLNKQDDIRIIPIQIAKGYKPEIEIKKTNNSLAPVLIKKTDPNIDYPHLTSDLANKLGKDLSFIAKATRKLGVIENKEYCTKIRTNRSGQGIPKYSDKALNYLKDYLDKHPDFSPYR